MKDPGCREPTSAHDSAAELLAKLSEDLLRAGHSVRFRATGSSMLPTIRDGEYVTVRPMGGRGVHPGEILLCRSGRRMTAHRVIRKWRTRDGAVKVVLRGDATRNCDEPVDESDLLGRLRCVERDGRVLRLAGRWQRARFLAREAVAFFLTSVGAAAIRVLGGATAPVPEEQGAGRFGISSP